MPYVQVSAYSVRVASATLVGSVCSVSLYVFRLTPICSTASLPSQHASLDILLLFSSHREEANSDTKKNKKKPTKILPVNISAPSELPTHTPRRRRRRKRKEEEEQRKRRRKSTLFFALCVFTEHHGQRPPSDLHVCVSMLSGQ